LQKHPILKDADSKMKKSVLAIEEELKHLRTGRPSPAVLEEIKVDYYGTPTPINQLSTITVGNDRSLTIKPWDKNMLKPIEKAILASDLGLNPINDGTTLKLVFPTPTTEQRQKWVKKAKDIVEQGKIAVRNVRRESIKDVKKMQNEGTISEDDARRLEDEIQKITDEHIKELDKIFENKEKEIMEF